MTQLRPGWHQQDDTFVNPSINGRVWCDDGRTWCWSVDQDCVGGVGTGCRSAWRAMVDTEKAARLAADPDAAIELGAPIGVCKHAVPVMREPNNDITVDCQDCHEQHQCGPLPIYGANT